MEKVYYSIGDIHGRFAALKKLVKLINKDIEENHLDKEVYIVQVGDIMDRGEDSKATLELMMQFEEQFPKAYKVVVLQGNHEEHVCRIWRGEDQFAEGWFDQKRGTGHTTLRDYGVDVSKIKTGEDIGNAVRQYIPEPHIEFMENLPVKFETENYFFCHAGVNPELSLKKQTEKDLRWIRDPFLSHEDMFEKIVVHGHTPISEGKIQHNRVNTDAGAAYGGKLKCFILPHNYKIEDVRTLEVDIDAPCTLTEHEERHKG